MLHVDMRSLNGVSLARECFCTVRGGMAAFRTIGLISIYRVLALAYYRVSALAYYRVLALSYYRVSALAY